MSGSPGASSLFPAGQSSQQHQPHWGVYADENSLPNRPGNILVSGKWENLFVGQIAKTTTDSGLYVCESVGTAGGGDATWQRIGGGALPFTQTVETISAVAVAGQQGFFLRWGAYVRQQDVLAVTVNGAPAAYSQMVRQNNMGWPQPTTADVWRGVWLGAPCAGGETVEITFRTRSLLVEAPEPIVTFAPGGALPVGMVPGPGNWVPNSYQGGGSWVPNAFVLPQRAGLQLELWRRSRKLGRFRQALTVPGFYQLRQAKHWSPWWRSALAIADGYEVVDPWVATIVNTSSWRANDFKLAWYDPATGARSSLSVRSIMVQQHSERNVSTPSPTHPNMSVWITGR